MQKVSYMGNGSTTEFTFNFPYFENSNIVVKVNNQSASAYSIIGTPAGLDADIPYTGGKVVFETAPSSLDSITISRNLSLERIVDYQPLAKIEPGMLNQDLNYMMEVLKDLQDELDDLHTQYTEIADKESTTALLAQISTIHDEIVAVNAQIVALGDISTLRQTVVNNGNNIATNSNNITTLDNRTTGLLDYVIASQAPSAANNYTWYRKYKSGWVEQGGEKTIAAQNSNTQLYTDVNLPITMANQAYLVNVAFITDGGSTTGLRNNANGRGTTKLTIGTYSTTTISGSYSATWEVKGLAA